MVHVKVCGVTTLADARMCIDAGVDALGLNFWSGSTRRCELDVARELVQTLAGRTLFVGVFVDADEQAIAQTIERVGLGCVQLHGQERPELVERFLPHAYKALRVRDESVLRLARAFPGEHILLDAYVPGLPGGTGAVFDWRIAHELARERKVTLAGGLTPDNVADAVRAVAPFCVDTASGVEVSPGHKSEPLVRAFVERAKAAAQAAGAG